MTDEREILLLATALAIGLLIGIERGWHGLQQEKSHIPGVRTFGLIGLLGGVTGLATRQLEQPLLGLVFLAFAGTMVTTYVLGQRKSENAGITSLIASLLTFGLGALATLGHIVPAAATAVVATLLLGFKPLVKRWIGKIEELELQATLKLLLITVVLLPILPDRGFGPGGVLNPYQIWWMVVMIASISFSGYFAVRSLGVDKGVALTAFFAGLASSTALTLHFSRLARRPGASVDLLAGAILLATTTLFPRILVIAAVLHLELAVALAAPMAAMAALVLAPALLIWQRRDGDAADQPVKIDNPLELGAALRFGALLAAVMLLVRLLRETYGGTGLLAVGLISGLVDLNAITLSVARMGAEALDQPLAVATIVLASVSNSVFKGIMAWSTGGTALGIRVALPMLAASAAGVATAWLTGNWPTW